MARLSIEYLFQFVCYGDSLLVVDTWVACKQYRFSNYSVFVMLVLLIERPPPPHAHAIIVRGEAPSLVIYSLPSWDSANNGGVWKIRVGVPQQSQWFVFVF